MRAKGYEIKGETFEEGAAQYISFRPLDKDRFVRGSTKSLGKEYTKERIKERIEMKRERKAVIPKKDYSARKLIDTSDEKFQNSPGLQRWAAIENLKIASQSYNEAGSLSELEHKIAVKTETGKSAKQSVVELEQVGINLKGLNVDKLKAELEELTKQKNELTSTYKNCEKEARKTPLFPKPLAKSAIVVYNQVRNRRILACPTVAQSETYKALSLLTDYRLASIARDYEEKSVNNNLL